MQAISKELSQLDETQKLISGLSLKKLKKKYETTINNNTADDELREEMRAAGLGNVVIYDED